MSSIIYKNAATTPIRLRGGEGVWLLDEHGNRYLDTCGGVAVSSLGHCHPRIVEAMKREASKLCWAHAGSFTTDAAEELAELLTDMSNGLQRAQFLSGGSEIMELSLKIAYQYQCEIGQPGRKIFIARKQGYHGSTLGMLAISGNRQRRSIFEPLLMPAEFVSPCYAYRDKLEDETDADYAQRLAQELDHKIREVGPGNVAAFVAETVVGSSNGGTPAVPGYLKRIKQVCERHGVLLVLDEVMAGAGRTGLPFAYLEDGIVPDIVAIGKGLAAGYQPISAVLVSGPIHQAIAGGSGVLRNGQTHINHPFACAIALEVQRTIQQDGLLANVLERGKQLKFLLQAQSGQLECMGDVRGRGLFLGVEFVEDRKTKAPFCRGDKFTAALKAEAFSRNLLIYPGSGTIDGVRGNHVLFAPPFISTEADIQEMVDRFVATVKACI